MSGRVYSFLGALVKNSPETRRPQKNPRVDVNCQPQDGCESGFFLGTGSTYRGLSLPPDDLLPAMNPGSYTTGRPRRIHSFPLVQSGGTVWLGLDKNDLLLLCWQVFMQVHSPLVLLENSEE